MKIIRLKKNRKFTDRWGSWIQCTDLNGKEWTIPEAVFDQFRLLGLPTLDPKMEEEFHQLLGGKHYPELPKEVRYRMIKHMLERCTNEPLEFLFPNI